MLLQKKKNGIYYIAMNRNFVFAIILGVISLSVFAYFIFGLNAGPASTTTTTDIQKESADNNQANVKIEDLKVGTGAAVKNGDTVVIDYHGTLANGTKFDSSYDRHEPFETQIGVGQVIKGWDLGVVGMKVGGKRKLTIPPELGYGDQAVGKIPPNSILIFEVELREIK